MSSTEDLDDLIKGMVDAERCFRRACRQILVMNRVLSDLQWRYDMAMKQQTRVFRYSLRVRIAVTEGVRNMFYEYATLKADLIVELRKRIQEEHENGIAALDDDADDNVEYSREYYDEYDLSDSELEYSDIDFSDFEDEADAADELTATDALNDSAMVVNTVSASDIQLGTQGSRKLVMAATLKEADLDATEESIDSGYLDDSNIEDDFK